MGPFLVKSWLFQKMSILVVISLLKTPVYQQGSVQKFWKFARLLNVIWAFRKNTFQVDQRKSIFLNRAVSQTVPLKHFNFLNKMVNLDLTLQKKALFSFNRALTGLKVVTEKIIWVSTQIGCSRAGLQPSVN